MNRVVTALAAAFFVCGTGSACAAVVTIPEGTEVPIRFDDRISSGTASQGDKFTISLDDDLVLPDGTVIAAGYKGVGEVTDAEKRGMMGQAGKLNVRFNYLKIGDSRLRLRGSKGGEGKDKVGTTIVLTVLFGPLGLLKRGKDIEIQPGQTMTAYADDDLTVDVPVVAARTPAPAAVAPAAPAPATAN